MVNNNNPVSLHARLTQFEGSSELCTAGWPIAGAGDWSMTPQFAGASWVVNATIAPSTERPDALDGSLTFRVTAGEARQVAAALEWHVTGWSKQVFVMLPAAAYNGNRYPSRQYKYPPMIHEPRDVGVDAPIIISDVPRLSVDDGVPSRLQLTSGDVTTPCICFYDPAAARSAILLTTQGSHLGNHGLAVEESADRTSGVLRIEAPGMRRDTLYRMCNTAAASWDRAADWSAGTEVTINFRLLIFDSGSVQDLYDAFAVVRQDMSPPVALKQEFPFSAAFSIVEDKYNRENWREGGYYSVGVIGAGDSPGFDWQTGWVGGGMTPFPLLLAGGDDSRRRALQNLDWMFSRAQYPSGLLHAIHHDGEAYDDGFNTPGTKNWCMTRKQADALYFVVKALCLCHRRDDAWKPSQRLNEGVLLLADRLLTTFRRYGQLGQYIDCVSGEVVVGGSTASAIAPAAFALAGQFFDRPDYIKAAEDLAGLLDDSSVRPGVTTGGPGEILKCPDSESAFAMLESFVVLYEVTANRHWLGRAQAMAAQCVTWCASYDYKFPADSPLGRLDVSSAGSVWANVQNKHSAPGICTLSGDSLFKLFRYTGNKLWLEQIRQTAHNITQYISRSDRAVGDPAIMKPGYICERVNFSDWESPKNVGGNMFGSCWPEVSLLLTAVEVPGVYIQPDTKLLCVFDHVEARVCDSGCGWAIVDCRNPTRFDAGVRIFAEPSSAAGTILGQAAALAWPVVSVGAGMRRRFKVDCNGAVTEAF